MSKPSNGKSTTVLILPMLLHEPILKLDPIYPPYLLILYLNRSNVTIMILGTWYISIVFLDWTWSLHLWQYIMSFSSSVFVCLKFSKQSERVTTYLCYLSMTVIWSPEPSLVSSFSFCSSISCNFLEFVRYSNSCLSMLLWKQTYNPNSFPLVQDCSLKSV